MADIAIVINNYFHDVATAVLLTSATIMYVLGKQAEKEGTHASATLFGFYATLTRFATGALVWIVVGGIPRVIFFETHEFIPARVNGLLVALGIKHALMFTAVAVGIVLWRSVRKKIEVAGTGGER